MTSWEMRNNLYLGGAPAVAHMVSDALVCERAEVLSHSKKEIIFRHGEKRKILEVKNAS